MALLKYSNTTQNKIHEAARLCRQGKIAEMQSGRHWGTRFDSAIEMLEDETWALHEKAKRYIEEFLGRYPRESGRNFPSTLDISERRLWNVVDNLFALYFVYKPFRTANPPRFEYADEEEFISEL